MNLNYKFLIVLLVVITCHSAFSQDVDNDGVLDAYDVDNNNDGVIDTSVCTAISGGASPQGDAISWTKNGLKIFSIANNTNGLGYQESGFQEEVYSKGEMLTVLNGSSDYSFPSSSWTAGSANTSVGTFANGTIDFESNYYRRTSSSRIALLRTTTAGNFKSGNSGHAVYIYPETGAQTGDYYTVNINFTSPVRSFSFDLIDIFDTNYDGGVISQYEIYVDDNLVGYYRDTFVGDDGTGNINLYDADGILKGSVNSGQNIENNFGITADTGIGKVSIKHIVVSGQMGINTHEPHGLDTFAYSFVCLPPVDIDSDDDGIPDNIEIQSTLGYIAPSGTVNTSGSYRGLWTNYGTGMTPVDTDEDGTPDYLDSDSDNDGIPDIQENGQLSTVSNLDTDADGLDNNFDSNNSSFDTNDEVSSGTLSDLVSAFGDADGDAGTGGDLDYRDIFNTNPPANATIDFDGVDDYLQGDSFIQGLGSFTIMAWVKIDASNAGNSSATIAGEGTSCRLYALNGNKLMFGIRTELGTTAINGIEINYDEWHHVTGTFSNITGEQTIYVDGEEQKKLTLTSLIGKTIQAPSSWNGDFEVGRIPWNLSNKQYFTGNIDEVRVFNTELSDEQIQQMVYQEIENVGGLVQGKTIPKPIKDTKTLQTLSWSNLLAYYPMTDIKNSTTSDYSSNNKTLKLNNISTVQEQTAPMPYQTGSNGDWSNQSTWLHGEVWDIEDASTNKAWSIVNIADNVTSSNSHTNLGLLIDSNKKLTISGDQKVENNWYLELNGTLDLNADSQLVQTENSDLVTSSTGKVLRRQEGNSSVYWYNYWASPVGSLGATTLSDNNKSSNNDNNSSYSLDMLKKPDGTNFEFTSAYDEQGKISTYWLYTYINGVTYYDYAFLNPDTALEPGVGYTSKGTGVGSQQEYVFEGKPNNGTIIVPVTDIGGNGSVPAVTKTDYLLGNPYASAIDLHKFIDDNAGVSDGTIQLWQQWSGASHILNEYNGGYAQVNKTGATRAYQFVGIEGANNGNQDGTKTPTRYLPVGQGFMTEIVNSGDIVFKNSQRVFIKESDADGSYDTGSVFFRSVIASNAETTTENLMQKLRLEFNSVDGPATRRELLLGFSEETSDGFDYGYDAKNVEEYDDDLNLILGDELMTIQAYSAITEDKVVPLNLKTSGTYNYTIKLTETENIPEDQDMFIKDNLTGEYYDLRSDQPFEFSSEAGEFANRFEVVFQEQSESLSINDSTLENLNFYYAMGRDKIVVLNPNSIEIKTFELYNIVGQSVYKTVAYQGTYNEYDVNGLSTGAYIMRLNTLENGVLTKKVVVK
ncbi:LamG-like jellyroll fold domain-containing protein [Winogradskyella luteola]|uniref:T9SS type A sorting domain-containing protein n=1 Tax=Winogradskyella luteola TaxID=2828330 RepID=A0A9X1JPL9_9FLAO|nr:LamG-like jellyroll fold domain-containing protein [Winogradskyella luteola]MBV7268839.1 T9SS type A sorting domain-containing protein [Winogradskyella luteola]